MTNSNAKLSPPPEMVKQLYKCATAAGLDYLQEIADRSAQWGADQELEACCELLEQKGWDPTWIPVLRAARRPKPPSLKEQALAEIDALESMGVCNSGTIRRAIESLPND